LNCSSWYISLASTGHRTHDRILQTCDETIESLPFSGNVGDTLLHGLILCDVDLVIFNGPAGLASNTRSGLDKCLG
jgi:hypothetical protein